MVTGAVAGPRVIAGSIVSELAVCAKQPGSHRLTARASAKFSSVALLPRLPV